MTRGICPFAVWRPVRSFGYPQGKHGDNLPLLFVDHIMSGYKSTMDRPGWQEEAGISAHFGLGDDGSISQYVNIFDASWANGVVGGLGGSRRGIELYDRANPRLALMEKLGSWRYLPSEGVWTLTDGAGGNVWNKHTITTEHENWSGIAWSEAKLDASVRVKRWVNEELGIEGYQRIPFTHEGLIRHGQIDAINRSACPGSAWPVEEMLRRLGGGATGGWDMFTRHNEVATWFENREIPGMSDLVAPYLMEARSDFKLPQEAVAVRFEVFMDRGELRFLDGSFEGHGDGYAGTAGNRGSMVAVVDAGLDSMGRVRFTTSADGAHVGRIVSLGYWT